MNFPSVVGFGLWVASELKSRRQGVAAVGKYTRYRVTTKGRTWVDEVEEFVSIDLLTCRKNNDFVFAPYLFEKCEEVRPQSDMHLVGHSMEDHWEDKIGVIHRLYSAVYQGLVQV